MITISGAITGRGGKQQRSQIQRTVSASKALTGAAARTRLSGAWSKLLHWLRHNPDRASRMATALEHCDMVAAVLCGIDGSSDGPA